MKLSKSQRNNIWFLIILVLLIIPQTRQPIQVFLQKGLAQFSPSVVEKSDREQLHDYNWKFTDLNATEYNFKEAEGQVILINFWATWCPPCIAEMPSLVALHANYKDKVEFLFVSNEDASTIQTYLTKKGFQIPVYKPQSTAPKLLETSSIPRTILIDKQGRLVIDKTGASNWNSETVHNTINVLLEQ